MLVSLLFVFTAWAAPKTLPAHRVFAGDGSTVEVPNLSVAVLGNTRPGTLGLDKARAKAGSNHEAVIGDITAVGVTEGLGAVFLMGDMVSSSSTANWAQFGTRHAAILDGTVAPPAAMRRLPTLPVVGDRDCIKEPSCSTLASVFPGFGVEIGFGRVATWQHLDLDIGGTTRWRILVLDSNKKGLGSRWQEQISWLKKAVKQPGDGIIVLMHESPISRGRPSKNSGPGELMETIGEHAPLLSVRAIISAGRINSQAFLPEGALGPIHIIAGAGGAPGEDLDRGILGNPSEPALIEPLETGLNHLVDSHLFNPVPPDPKAIDEALGKGSFTGYPRRVDAAVFPMHGWWRLRFQPGTIEAEWRSQKGDGTIGTLATVAWTAEDGWAAKP